MVKVVVRPVSSPERAVAEVTGQGKASSECRPCPLRLGRATVRPSLRLPGRPKLATSRISPRKSRHQADASQDGSRCVTVECRRNALDQVEIDVAWCAMRGGAESLGNPGDLHPLAWALKTTGAKRMLLSHSLSGSGWAPSLQHSCGRPVVRSMFSDICVCKVCEVTVARSLNSQRAFLAARGREREEEHEGRWREQEEEEWRVGSSY